MMGYQQTYYEPYAPLKCCGFDDLSVFLDALEDNDDKPAEAPDDPDEQSG